MNNSLAMIESSMCALLRGEAVAWPASRDSEFDARYRDRAAYHGLGPLLSRRLSHTLPCEHHFTESVCLARELKDGVAIELARKHELVRVLSALAEPGVRPLLLKGAALAYSIYPSPVLRPRADTDLLIHAADRAVTTRVLSALGYETSNTVTGELVMHQRGYVARDRFGMDHVLDVHWRISNTQMFSRALDYEELLSRSVPLAALGVHARGLAPADALLLACMHRAHHIHSPYWVDGVPADSGDRLIWLYDIHLMVDAMSPRELTEFARLTESKGMRAICSDGLLRARACFGTRVCEEVLLSLARKGPTEPSAAHLKAGKIRHLLTELRSLPRWRDRITLLAEHLIPPPDYMLEKYAVTNRALLPMLYLKRGIHGVWKRIQNL
jgi:predicted nucleic acid-binding protein